MSRTEPARARIARIRSAPGRDGWTLLLVGLLALLARCVVVVVTKHSFALINDAADYSRLGMSIADGHGFGTSHVAPGAGPTALRPPGFPLLLAGVYFIVGPHVLAARVTSALLGATAAVLVSVLIRQLSGDPRRALAGGLIAAVFPPMVLASTSVMSEALFVPLSLGVIVGALAYRRSGRLRSLALSGFLLGCAALTRPVGGIVVLPAALIAFSRPPPSRPRLIAALLAACLAVAPCAAWEVRDIVVLHHVIPLTTQTGYLLAGTYNATSAHLRSQPGAWIVPTQDPGIALLVKAHPYAQEASLGDALRRAAMRYAEAHPSYILTVLGHNILRLFDFTDLAFDQAVVHGEYGYGSLAGTIEYVSALALVVLAALALLRRGASQWPLGVWLTPLLLVLVTVPVQGFSRFRAPIDPYLVALASGLLATLVGRGRWLGRAPHPAVERWVEPARGEHRRVCRT